MDIFSTVGLQKKFGAVPQVVRGKNHSRCRRKADHTTEECTAPKVDGRVLSENHLLLSPWNLRNRCRGRVSYATLENQLAWRYNDAAARPIMIVVVFISFLFEHSF